MRYDEDSEKDKWSEFVDDLWSHEKLEHMREMTATVDYALVYDPVKGAYGFDDETEDYEDEESVPIEGAIIEEKESPQLNQLQNVNEEAPLPPPPASTSNSDLSAAAEKITPEDISDYLRSLKLDEYIDEFLENDIDGNLMYDVDDDTLESVGVTTKKDRIKIKGRFKQWLRKRAAEIKQ